MTPLHCQFSFHPVGQGLFYSGQINNFNFVYDCGSHSGEQYIQNAINAYDFSSDKLDLLILSHFHEDHVNGIKKLLAKTHGVKRVILPYLLPQERLMVATEYALINRSTTVNEEYLSFLRDPVAFLRGIDGSAEATITYLRNEEPTNEVRPAEGSSSDFNQEFKWTADQGKSEENGAEVRSHLTFLRSSFWEFKFYCQPSPITPDVINQKLLSKFTQKEIDDVSGLLCCRLKDLKDIYHELFGGTAKQNSTSIICCHGPSPKNPRRVLSHNFVIHSFSLPVHRKLPYRGETYSGSGFGDGWGDGAGNGSGDGSGGFYENSIAPAGFWGDVHCKSFVQLPLFQLLTGDSNLSSQLYITHFADELRKVGLVQIPHHGSKRNWDFSFFASLPHCVCCVASFGFGNSHRHPSASVVSDILSNKRHFLSCNQTQGFTVKGEYPFHSGVAGRGTTQRHSD